MIEAQPEFTTEYDVLRNYSLSVKFVLNL